MASELLTPERLWGIADTQEEFERKAELARVSADIARLYARMAETPPLRIAEVVELGDGAIAGLDDNGHILAVMDRKAFEYLAGESRA